jgi:hypothetical protein
VAGRSTRSLGVTKRRMRSVSLVAAFGLISVACAKGPSFGEFRSTVKDLAGTGARDCGVIRLRETNHRLLDCAREAIQSNEPFAIIVQRQGIDSQIFSGLVRSKTGEIWSVDWDSDITGSSGGGSSMKKTRCARMNLKLGSMLTMSYSAVTPNHALEPDRDSSWPRCARNELRARQRGIAAWPAAQLGR